MPDKSPDAFRTISEVAEDLDLPQHVLRFWETRFPQIKPLKRGGGRRYYRPDDVALIMGLKALLYGEGYTIKGVQRILKEQGAKSVQAVGRGGALPTGAAVVQIVGAPKAVSPAQALAVALPGDSVSESAARTASLDEQSRAHMAGQAPPEAEQAAHKPLDADVEHMLRAVLGELQSARQDLMRALALDTEA